jgi:hypothetical protein
MDNMEKTDKISHIISFLLYSDDVMCREPIFQNLECGRLVSMLRNSHRVAADNDKQWRQEGTI